VSVGTLASDDPAEGTVQLVLGKPLAGDDEPYRSDTRAIHAAQDASHGRTGAVAVVQLGLGWRLYALRRRDGDVCAVRSKGESDPVHIEDMRGYHFIRLNTSIPGSVVELQVDYIADDPIVVAPKGVTPSALSTLAEARCK
jgi:hypothetical protein